MMKQTVKVLTALVLSSVLSACYIVPASSATRVVATSNTPSTAAPTTQNTLNARLYPSNAEAQRVGGVNATVTVDQTGHGRFNALIAGENFSGDATRELNSRRGTANGSAASGRYISCEYTMNSATLGKGECKMSTGAVFEMHVTR